MIRFVKVVLLSSLSFCIFALCTEMPVQFEDDNIPYINLGQVVASSKSDPEPDVSLAGLFD